MEWYMASYSTSIADASNLRAAMNTNSAYEGLCHPMKEEQGGTWKGRGRDVEQLCGTALWDIVFVDFVDGNAVGWKERRWESMETYFFSGKNYPKASTINIHPHPSSTNFSDSRRLHAGLQLPISQRRRSHGLVLHPWRRRTAGGEDP